MSVQGDNDHRGIGPEGGITQSAIEHDAVQCGFCTPGWLLSAKVLLENNPAPTREEVRTAIAGNICRCTGYKRIEDAILAAAGKNPE
jgi:carbon-monoxide dehydrogenase small subunit